MRNLLAVITFAACAFTAQSHAESREQLKGKVVGEVGRCQLRAVSADPDVYVLQVWVPMRAIGQYEPAAHEYVMRNMKPRSSQFDAEELKRFVNFVKSEARAGGLCQGAAN